MKTAKIVTAMNRDKTRKRDSTSGRFYKLLKSNAMWLKAQKLKNLM